MGLCHVYEAFRLEPITGAARAVAIVLAIHANEKRQTWPSLGTIAREAGINRATAFRAVQDLENAGVIIRIGKKRVGGRHNGQATRAAGQTVNLFKWHGICATHTH